MGVGVGGWVGGLQFLAMRAEHAKRCGSGKNIQYPLPCAINPREMEICHRWQTMWPLRLIDEIETYLRGTSCEEPAGDKENRERKR